MSFKAPLVPAGHLQTNKPALVFNVSLVPFIKMVLKMRPAGCTRAAEPHHVARAPSLASPGCRLHIRLVQGRRCMQQRSQCRHYMWSCPGPVRAGAGSGMVGRGMFQGVHHMPDPGPTLTTPGSVACGVCLKLAGVHTVCSSYLGLAKMGVAGSQSSLTYLLRQEDPVPSRRVCMLKHMKVKCPVQCLTLSRANLVHRPLSSPPDRPPHSPLLVVSITVIHDYNA